MNEREEEEKEDLIKFILEATYKTCDSSIKLESFKSREETTKKIIAKYFDITEEKSRMNFTNVEKSKILCNKLYEILRNEIHPIYLSLIFLYLIETLKNIKLIEDLKIHIECGKERN